MRLNYGGDMVIEKGGKEKVDRYWSFSWSLIPLLIM